MEILDAVQPGENPLVPNAVLRQMHTAIQALRRSSSRGATSARCPRGQEAICTSALLTLRAGDLVSDLPGRALTQTVVQALQLEAAPTPLPIGATSPHQRLLLAVGAAAALRAQAAGAVLLAFAGAADLKRTQWQEVLGLAGASSLPILFIALPGKTLVGQGWLSDHAQGFGVPGIPVDLADAVALYRVLQESALRARHGDGPALLEPIAWTLDGSSSQAADPLRTMQQLLRQRGLLDAPLRTSRPSASQRPTAQRHRSE